MKTMKTLNMLTLIIGLLCAVWLIAVTACSEDESKDSSKDSSSIGQCEDLVDALSLCYDLAEWGIESVESGKADCADAPNTTDDYDRCLFACDSVSTDCQDFQACVDNCG